MKNLYFSILLFFVPFYLNAQSYYKPGYWVNAKNDTIKGFVERRESFNNPRQFNFKADLGQQTKIVSLKNAVAVGITGYDYYEKFVAEISQSYLSTGRLIEAIDTSYVVDTVFLRVIAKGKNVTLYGYTDNIKTRFYVLDQSAKKLKELKYNLYIDAETRSAVTVNSFRSQLLSIAGLYQPNNIKLSDRIRNSSYDQNDLIKIIELINGDIASGLSASKNTGGSRWFFGLGGLSSKLTFNGQSFVFPDGYNKNSFSPTVSGGIDYLLNTETQKSFLRLEVAFAYNKYNMDNVQTSNFSGDEFGSLDFSMFTTMIHPQFVYNIISEKNFKFFLNIGVSANISSYNNYSYITKTVINPTLTTSVTQNKFPAFQSVWFTTPAKIGIIITNLEIYAAYWPSGTITRYQGNSASVTSYQAGINYLFR